MKLEEKHFNSQLLLVASFEELVLTMYCMYKYVRKCCWFMPVPMHVSLGTISGLVSIKAVGVGVVHTYKEVVCFNVLYMYTLYYIRTCFPY